MKRFLLLLVAMTQLFGCSARSKADLTYFKYTFGSTMVANGGEVWTVELKTVSSALVTIAQGQNERSFTTSAKILDEINAIVLRNKMYRYKGSYRPSFEVLDGWAWSFSLRYSDGKMTDADGYMKYPAGGSDAFKEITECLERSESIPDSARMWAFDYDTHNGMVMGGGKSFSVMTDKEDGMVHIAINKGKHYEKSIVTDYTEIYDDLNQIVLKYNIFTFKGTYSPDTEVWDGDSWSLHVFYDDDKSDIRASGYMAWPEGFRPAEKAIMNYSEAWRILAGKGRKVSAEAAAAFVKDFAAMRKTASYDPETGGYSITTLDEDGNPARTINYNAAGDVLNGTDYKDPLKEF